VTNAVLATDSKRTGILIVGSQTFTVKQVSIIPDISGDGKLGLAEVIYILQIIAGMR
jgi:hypothetical protein